ncbi:hypothetical protein LCGC14_2014180 [marine sediment metagenome]|uniref:Translation elongation factor-like protein n=1 Tax=marine sediment metagenome TaxID=412755 RepID=A0A0F9EZF5_9ZZZZ
MKQIGKVTHYFDKISVAVIELSGVLKAGDTISFQRGGEELFQQEINSMQIDHEAVKKAKKGDDVAIKVDEKVREGVEVFKV